MGSVAGEERGTVPVPPRENTASTKWFFQGECRKRKSRREVKRERRDRETRKLERQKGRVLSLYSDFFFSKRGESSLSGGGSCRL